MSKFDIGEVARFVLRVEFIPYVVFTVIGGAVVYVLGSIGLSALHNGSFIPPPTKLERYDCSAPSGSFSILYLHGTDRVKIKSLNGSLDGTVQKNHFDCLHQNLELTNVWCLLLLTFHLLYQGHLNNLLIQSNLNQ